jgi:hypothetical protein
VTRVVRFAAAVFGPLWVTAFRDPVREGRLRLDALSRPERQLARAGLVMLAILLGSLLFSARWRRGELLPIIGGPNQLTVLPVGALGLTLLALVLAWALVFWGALDASPVVRLAVAAAFALSMATLDSPAAIPGLDTWWMRHGPAVVHAGFLVSCGGLVVSALLSSTGRVGRIVDAVLRGVVVVALAAFLLGRLAMYVSASRSGQPSTIPFEVDSTIGSLAGLSVPLVFMAAVVVVDLAHDVATSLEEPARRLPARWALLVLLALVAVKLYVAVVAGWQVWVDLVQNQPLSVTRAVGSMALLALLVVVTSRFPASERFIDAKEKVVHLGSTALAAPLLLGVLGFGLAALWFTEFDSRAALDANDHVPYDALSRWYPLAAAVLVIAVGAWLMRRSRGGYGDELGSALVVVGGWNVPASIESAFSLGIPLSLAVVDVLAPVGALVLVAVMTVRRRTVPAPLSVLLIALVLFSWLVMSRGDYISFAGGLLGLSSVVVLAFGVVYSLLSDSAFASESSRRLPREARPMLFVGYTLVSVVIVHWIELTHELEDLEATAAFTRIAIPLAAWLVGRRLVRGTGSSGGEPGALTEEVGHGVDTTQR